MNVKVARVSMVPAGTILDLSVVNVHLAASWTRQEWYVLVGINSWYFPYFLL